MVKYKVANVFLGISPHSVLAQSIRECYELTNQQQSSPLILPTLKRKENEQITLLTSLAQLTTSYHVWQQYFHTRQILSMKNHEEYFDNFPSYKFHLSSCCATWKSLININLPQHAISKDHKIQDAILFPAVAYLELVTTACQQLLPRKEDDQEQPTIIFEDIKFFKALILNEHELVEVFIQIIMPMREWYIIFCNQDNLNKYSLNEFTLHAQSKIEIDSKQQKSLTIPDRWTIQDIRRAYQYETSFEKFKTLRGISTTIISELSNNDKNCSSYYLLRPYLVLLPGIETTFLPVHIQKFIYSNKINIKMNQSTNIEVRGIYHDNIYGIGQEGTYSLDLWMFPMDNKIEAPVFTFQSIIIQELQGVQSGRWSMQQTIYDKLNLTTDLPNKDHKLYLNTIIKDYCLLPSPNQILNNQLNSIINQDLIESIEPLNELAAYYAQMAIKDLGFNHIYHPLLNTCRSLVSILHSKQIVAWHSIQLRFIQLSERFPRLKLFLIILNKYGLHLKDILSGEKNGLDIFFGDDDIGETFQQIKTLLSATKTQQTKDNSFENYRLRIFCTTLEKIPIKSFDIIFSSNQRLGNQDLTNCLISLRRLLVPIGLLLILKLVHVPLYFDLIFGFIDQCCHILSSLLPCSNIRIFHIRNSTLDVICSTIPLLLTIHKQVSLNENNDDLPFKQNEELLCGTLSRILQTIKKTSPHFYPFVYVITDNDQFNNDSNLII
ncbi:unnamed protein product [Adineta steineri]|uniref:PKS/mFAS DH domain-containing protein n=2 Tax=Bdelloidea TaxID=44578 RepID=A0A819S6S3_9BILA|nr:unnamed protein product [Adineta steineri]